MDNIKGWVGLENLPAFIHFSKRSRSKIPVNRVHLPVENVSHELLSQGLLIWNNFDVIFQEIFSRAFSRLRVIKT